MLLFAACGGGNGDTPTPTRRPPDTVTPAATSSTPMATPSPTVTATSTPVAPTTDGTSPPVAVDISTDGDALAFDKGTLSASAGAEVVLTFANAANSLQHNWVLVQAGAKDEVADAGTAAGPQNDWIPEDGRIIAATKLLDGGASGEARFTAPGVGTYEFVCTFPGHNAAGMFGVFEVTP